MPPQRSVNAPQVGSRAPSARRVYDVDMNMVINGVPDVVTNTENLHVNARAPNKLVLKRRILYFVYYSYYRIDAVWSQRCFYLREFAAAPPPPVPKTPPVTS